MSHNRQPRMRFIEADIDALHVALVSRPNHVLVRYWLATEDDELTAISLLEPGMVLF